MDDFDIKVVLEDADVTGCGVEPIDHIVAGLVEN